MFVFSIAKNHHSNGFYNMIEIIHPCPSLFAPTTVSVKCIAETRAVPVTFRWTARRTIKAFFGGEIFHTQFVVLGRRHGSGQGQVRAAT